VAKDLLVRWQGARKKATWKATTRLEQRDLNTMRVSELRQWLDEKGLYTYVDGSIVIVRQ
jgi:hypothetical protein